MVNSQTPDAPLLHWSMPIASWAVWDARQAELTGEKPELTFVDAMQRRRLSPLARAAFHVAHRCAGKRKDIPLVYASRHGELQRTMELFLSMATQEALSPTTFGLSVLNANAGLYSIARQETAAATAISAGSETFGFGLLEAWTRAKDTNGPVLYVYADAPVPTPLPALEEDTPDVLAIGLMIDPAATEQLHCTAHPTAQASADSTQAQALAFLPALTSARQSAWSGTHRSWQWAR